MTEKLRSTVFLKSDVLLRMETLESLPTPPWRPIPSRLVAELLGVSLQSLANWRVRGTGPEPEPYKRGQGNRTMYRPDVVMAWLSGWSSEPKQPWEYSRQWLIGRGLTNLPADQASVDRFAAFADQHRYFSSRMTL